MPYAAVRPQRRAGSEKHKVTSFMIPRQLADAIDKQAKRAGKTRSQMIREALEDRYLDRDAR